MKGERPDIEIGELIELPDRWLVKNASISADNQNYTRCAHAREGFIQDRASGKRRRTYTLDCAWLKDGDTTQIHCVPCALELKISVYEAFVRCFPEPETTL